jgi:hypothetical protein
VVCLFSIYLRFWQSFFWHSFAINPVSMPILS